MNNGFEKLPLEKKKKIIDVCIKEFGEKGYINASTNKIVENAEISKGTLFNYFGNKKKLFLYVLDCTTDYYIEYMKGEMKENSPDLFKRVLDWASLKIRISSEAPYVFNFFVAAYTNVPDELTSEINERYQNLYKIAMPLTLNGLDYSMFRDDIDKNKAIEIIIMTFSGLTEKYKNSDLLNKDKGFSTMNERFEILKEYVDILKKVFYK